MTFKNGGIKKMQITFSNFLFSNISVWNSNFAPLFSFYRLAYAVVAIFQLKRNCIFVSCYFLLISCLFFFSFCLFRTLFCLSAQVKNNTDEEYRPCARIHPSAIHI